MAQERNYWVLCDDNCRFPAMDKEQTLTAIQQAVSTGTIQNIDAGFITKIQELNANNQLQFWVGTTAEYNAITEKAENTLYLLTDDNTLDVDGIVNSINELQTKADNLATKDTELESTINANKTELDTEIANIKNGQTIVGEAHHSKYFSPNSWVNATSSPYNVYKAGMTYEIYFEYQSGGSGVNFAKYLIFSIMPGSADVIYLQNIIYDYGSTNIEQESINLRKQSDGTYALEIGYSNVTNLRRRVVGGIPQ